MTKKKKLNLTNAKINSIKKNLFHRSLDIIEDFHTFSWHQYKGNIDTDQINSSQAIAIDFWGCIHSSPYKNELINELFGTEAEEWNIELEYTDCALLNEPTSTQIDVFLQSPQKVIFVESKFTEKGGPCTQPLKQCNGNYEIQTNQKSGVRSKCALTGKKIRYWDFIEQVTDYKKDYDYTPCPFKGKEYQWMRTICFAKAYSDSHNKIPYAPYLFYYDSPKCPISGLVGKGNYLGTLEGHLKSPEFEAKSYNDCIEKCIDFLKSRDLDEMNVWEGLKQWISDKEARL